MPVMKGDETLMIVHQRQPSTRLVLVAGRADERDIARLSGAVRLGASLVKPWNPERLFHVVAALG